jgi:hypothetical protein
MSQEAQPLAKKGPRVKETFSLAQFEAELTVLRKNAPHSFWNERRLAQVNGPALAQLLDKLIASLPAPEGPAEASPVELSELMVEGTAEFSLTSKVALTLRHCIVRQKLILRGSAKSVTITSSRLEGDGLEIVVRPGETVASLRIDTEEGNQKIAILGRGSDIRYARPHKLDEVTIRGAIRGLRIEHVVIRSLDINATATGANCSLESVFIDKFSLRGTFDQFKASSSTLGESSSRETVIFNGEFAGGFEFFQTTFFRVSFRYCRAAHHAYFISSSFMASADFTGFRSDGPTSFRKCWLMAPLLIRDAVFSQAPDVRDIQCQNFVGEDIVLCYRTLLRIAEDAGTQLDASRYFAYEQRAIRKTKTGFRSLGWEPMLSCLYDWVSVYGSSASRAISSFLLWNVTAGLFFVISDGAKANTPIAGLLPAGVGLALQDIVNPIALFTDKPAFLPTSTQIFALAVVQSIGSVVILALLLLALRRRFHKASE